MTIAWRILIPSAAGCGLALLCASGTEAAPPALRTVGENRPYSAESPAGLKGAGRVWTDEIHSPGARFIRVHFAELDLARGDAVVVSDPARSMTWTYTGRGPNGNGEFWSFAVPGDTAVVTLLPRTGGRRGYRVDSYAHGTEDVYAVEPEAGAFDVGTQSICGTDGKRDAACFPAINSRPVARLLFSAGSGQALCTGSLVAAPNPNTLITNNHCMSNQAGVSSLQAMFNFQRATCGGTTDGVTTSFAGGQFLRTSPVNGGLDYTLLTLQGNPEAQFGEYTAAAANAPIGRNIYIVQHPGGRRKQIAEFENSAQTVRCQIQGISGTQTRYNCDTEGGSSGSSVLDATTNRIIGLHHFGGCPHNSATMIRPICDHAGPGLLTCGGGPTPTPTPQPGGNLALNRPATGSTPCNGDETPAKAVNGSVGGGNSDKFCSLAATKFLQVDLGSVRTVGRFVVKHAGEGGESTTFNTRAYTIQVSTDGASFSTVVSVTANTANTSTHAVSPVSARFVRLNVTTPQQTAGGAARIYELEAYVP
jgi:lysyl endopeptidase